MRRTPVGFLAGPLAGILLLVGGCSAADQPGEVSSSTPSGGTTAGPSSPSSPSSPSASPTPEGAELPRGGRELFPTYRLVGYSGHPYAKGQGRLGIGKLEDRVKEMEKRAKPYGKDRQVLPVLELITTTVHSKPGKDGKYRGRTEDKIIAEHLRVAREHKGILLLNIQPGQAKFIDEVKALEKWLREPDVGLALDPEWAVKKGQVPGRAFGSTTGKELDEVAGWTADLVAEHNLPEKALVYHQLNPDIVRKESDLKEHDGVALIKSVDGIGSHGAKVDTWKRLVKNTPKHVHLGFKLFYEEDTEGGTKLMSPQQVLALKPKPEYVLYE
ncbi:hypothetical protein ACQCX2_05075 [Propionibacteriaceae bacterium Y1700]|uniref:hypothetical protein n=1 Tax=Microlunatus sp. Y1700 TaxID=3418487 RepID=UPI003DA7898E